LSFVWRLCFFRLSVFESVCHSFPAFYIFSFLKLCLCFFRGLGEARFVSSDCCYWRQLKHIFINVCLLSFL
jgi:hypothetical protein